MSMKTTDLGEETIDAIIKRLRRIEGQVRGLQKMVSEGRACDQVLMQMTAVRKAMESAANVILKEYLTLCAADVAEGDPARPEEIANVLKKFV